MTSIIVLIRYVIDTNYFVYTEGLDKRIFDHTYDLAFLDIDLKTVDGIALAEKLREKRKSVRALFLYHHIPTWSIHLLLFIHTFLFAKVNMNQI